MVGSLDRRTTAALEVVELPPPTPSSWRGSSAPKAAVRMASRPPASSIKGSTSTALNSQHLLVPPRIQVPRSVNTAWPAFRSNRRRLRISEPREVEVRRVSCAVRNQRAPHETRVQSRKSR